MEPEEVRREMEAEIYGDPDKVPYDRVKERDVGRVVCTTCDKVITYVVMDWQMGTHLCPDCFTEAEIEAAKDW